MKLGMFTSGYQRNPLEHCFEDANRFGYDYIELWGGRPHAFAPDLKNGEIENVKYLINKYEIPVLGYTPEHNAYPYNFMIGSESQRENAVEYLKLCLEMAKEMKSDYMLISPAHAGYYATRKEIWDRLETTVQELTDYAEKQGVKIVIETLTPYESNVLKNAMDAKELLDKIDSPYLMAMCDVVPPFVQHEGIMAYFELLGEKMYHLHLIDGEQGTDDHIIPGEGSIPIPELIKELKYIGYDRSATIELVLRYINEPRLYARRAIDNVRQMMAAAGID